MATPCKDILWALDYLQESESLVVGIRRLQQRHLGATALITLRCSSSSEFPSSAVIDKGRQPADQGSARPCHTENMIFARAAAMRWSSRWFCPELATMRIASAVIC